MEVGLDASTGRRYPRQAGAHASRRSRIGEKPEFLGSLYNLVVWQPKDAEHAYFRVHAPRAGEMAPDFTLPSLDGGEVALSSLRGKPTVIEFGSIT